MLDVLQFIPKRFIHYHSFGVGLFANYLVSASTQKLYVIDGRRKTIHCEAPLMGTATLVTAVDPRPAAAKAMQMMNVDNSNRPISDSDDDGGTSSQHD